MLFIILHFISFKPFANKTYVAHFFRFKSNQTSVGRIVRISERIFHFNFSDTKRRKPVRIRYRVTHQCQLLISHSQSGFRCKCQYMMESRVLLILSPAPVLHQIHFPIRLHRMEVISQQLIPFCLPVHITTCQTDGLGN